MSLKKIVLDRVLKDKEAWNVALEISRDYEDMLSPQYYGVPNFEKLYNVVLEEKKKLKSEGKQ